MATTLEYIQYVCDQIEGVGNIRYRKMFGEYMVYVEDRPVLLVCDNTVFVKILPEIGDMMQGANTGTPYEGAKVHYILDIEDRDLCQAVIAILKTIIPVPKPRKKK
ncbi:TfoX/Sxy family protein [Eubacterium barkeri]|nr:TfoX/Sxy family protein [Eubacterium barkeri]